MPNLEIPFTDEQFRAVAAQALAQGVSAAARDKLISDALLAAMRPQGYSSKSLVEDAFNSAVRALVHKAVTEAVECDPAILERVRASTREAIDKILTSKSFSVSQMVASAITDALEKASN